MSEYGWKLSYLLSLTKSQIILFSKKASNRVKENRKFEAKIHNMKINSNTLDIDGAVPIENLLNKGGGKL